MSVHPVLYVDHVTMLSGGERSLVDLARALDRTRFEPVLACPGEGPLARAWLALGFRLMYFSAEGSLLSVSRGALDTSFAAAIQWVPATLRVASRVASIARTTRARLIASNSLKGHVIASFASWMTGLPLVWHMRDCLEPSRAAWGMGLLAKASASRIIAISDAVVHSLAAAGGFPMSRVVRVHNGLDLPRQPGNPVLRRELPLPPGAVLVGTLGQLSRWKGIHVLLEAARALPGVHVAVVGPHLFGENEETYWRELQELARAPELAGRVFFVGPREDVRDVMASFDVFVHPAIAPEPFGRVLVEAMAAGRPIVASDAGAVREVTGDAAVLVPPGDPRALADALFGLLADPARRERLGALGAERARAHFAIDICRAATEAVYAQALGEVP